MPVLVEDSTETLVSSYIQPGDLAGVGNRRGQRSARSGVCDAVPLENSVSYDELGFCCGISAVAETISRCCYRSSIAC
jgi:hypothetical protein